MTLEQAIYNKLSGTAAIAALVANRIYAINAPENEPNPCITFSLASEDYLHAMGTDPAIYHPIYQVQCWGNTYDSATDLSETVITALQDFTGVMGTSGELTGVTVQRIFLQSRDQDYDPVSESHSINLTFEIWHT